MNKPLHPLHAILLAGTVPLFLGVLLSDVAYFVSYEMQWKNFASWLIVGGLVFCGLTLLFTLVELARNGWLVPMKSVYIYMSLLLAIFILGFIDALVHAADAWASMPHGLVLSVIITALVIAAIWLGFFHSHARQAK